MPIKIRRKRRRARALLQVMYMTRAMTKAENGEQTVNYAYNGLGQAVTEKHKDGTLMEYQYNLIGQQTGYTLKNGSTKVMSEEYKYNNVNLLEEVKVEGKTEATYKYNKNGLLTSAAQSNGVTTTYTYNKASLLTGVSNKRGTSVISSYAYTYYMDGNQAKKTESTGAITSYVYDKGGRLKEETASDYGIRYEYDSRGNRTRMERTGEEASWTAYTYDGNNRLMRERTTIGQDIRETEYTYDKNGNMLNKIKGVYENASNSTVEASIFIGGEAGSYYESYEYNLTGQLKKAVTEGNVSEYTYGVNGLRLTKTVNGEQTKQVWQGSQMAAEFDGKGAVKAKYYRGNQLIMADVGGTKQYYTYDGHGDTVQLTNTSGTVIADYRYDAFGNQIGGDNGSVYNPFRYAGEYFDFETENIYLRARYYDTGMGRFISEDPIKDGMNWYVYCGGNPIKFIDPSGLEYVPLRSTIESLGGSVTWHNGSRTAEIWLDGQLAYASNMDSNGSYISSEGIMFCDANWLFSALAVTFDLGKGWTGRIERDASGGNHGRKHVHVYNGKESYAQNEDGSPHDGSKGSPPNSVKKELKNKKSWDWEAKEDDWIRKIDVRLLDATGVYIITYPNGRQVTYLNVYLSKTFAPNRQELIEYYTGPTTVNKSSGNTGGIYVPLPNPVPAPLPAPVPVFP